MSRMKRRLPLVGLLVAILAGCGGGGSSTASNTGQGPTPTVMNLYPVGVATAGGRLYIRVTAVGSASVSMPLIFDTGSAGIALYAPDILPSSMVSSSGFVFPAGATSLTYKGITVTSQQGTRSYGSATDGTTQTGNIGFAQVSFGDSPGAATTSVMPVFLYYSITSRATGQPIPPPPQQGIFGVNSVTNVITVPGTTTPVDGFPLCTPQTTGSCRVVSVFKYLQYPQGLNAGFMLTKATLQSCDITSAGSCTPQPILTIGLTPQLEAGFSTVSLTCPPPPSSYVGPPTMNGYPVCLAAIPQTTISVSGSATGMLTGDFLFDSGTPFNQVSVPSGSSFPTPVPDGADVLVTTPSGFTYTYTSAPGIANTTALVSSPGTASIIGIAYFTTNSLFVDFTTSTEGWK